MKAIKIIYVGLVVIVLMGFYYAGFYDGKKFGYKAHPAYQKGYDVGYMEGRDYLPSIIEIQERIGVEVDGVLGPLTQDAWDEITFTRYAEVYMNRIETVTGNEAQE